MNTAEIRKKKKEISSGSRSGLTSYFVCPWPGRLSSSSPAFTLIEVMIAVGIFSVVMVVSIGALLSLADANRKTQALQSVLYNLNTSIDGMVRAIRMGSEYQVINNGTELSFLPYGAPSSAATERWVYRWEDTNNDGAADRLVKVYKPQGFSSRITVPLTGKEVTIDRARFYLDGADPTDLLQPRILIILQGKAGADKVKTTTTFSIQASATQRLLDI
jgi:type II secretory pathway pseudopilin PulG